MDSIPLPSTYILILFFDWFVDPVEDDRSLYSKPIDLSNNFIKLCSIIQSLLFTHQWS